MLLQNTLIFTRLSDHTRLFLFIYFLMFLNFCFLPFFGQNFSLHLLSFETSAWDYPTFGSTVWSSFLPLLLPFFLLPSFFQSAAFINSLYRLLINAPAQTSRFGIWKFFCTFIHLAGIVSIKIGVLVTTCERSEKCTTSLPLAGS